MKHRTTPTSGRRAAGWLLGLALLFSALAAFAQQDPPGRVARLNFHQGTISFSPAGDDSWYDVVPNRPITTGDRLWTDRNARAELHVGSASLRMDDQTGIAVSELDDDTTRITAQQGSLQVRVRDELAGQRFEIDTANLAVVIDAPGDYRIEADPAAGTTRVAIAAGSATLYGEGGESMQLGARQQLTVSGRNLAAVSGGPVRAGNDAFERWVAERDRIEDQSISARYVSREVLGYQQLDNYGDWQNVPDYGSVWYPRNVDADWAPYRDGQWVDIAPWGWTWVDAQPWGFAPSHYGRWARIGPRWAWVPGRPNVRPVYAPALVGFVGGAHVGGRNGVGWFPLAPGEPWRPGYRASQRYIDEVNRAIAYQRQLARAEYLHRNTPGALSLVPVDIFGRGPIARRDFLRVPEDRIAQMQVAPAVPIAPHGERNFGGFGRRAAATPPAFQARQQQQFQFEQARQQQQAQQAQQQLQQRAAQAQAQAQQQLQLQQAQRIQQAQQRDALREQQELQQRAAQAQAQARQQMQQHDGLRQQQQERAAQAQAQAQAQQQMHLQAIRQQQEMQQRAAAQAQAQQMQQMQQMQQLQAMRAQQQAQQLQQLQQQQALRAQQQQQQAQQVQQQHNAMRQVQEAQQRAMQQRQQILQQRGISPGQPSDRP